MIYLLIIGTIAAIVTLMLVFKKQVRQWAFNFRAKLRMKSLRTAISEADQNKSKNGRKNIVVFSKSSGFYEPIEKKLLKRAHQAGKNKNNAAMTEGRKRMLAKKKKNKNLFTNDRVKQIEKKSLYVTD